MESGEALRNIATIYMEWGQFDKGISNLKETLEIFRKYGNKPSIAETYFMLGDAYSALEKTDEALQVLEQAQSIFREIDNKEGIASVLTKKGDLQFNSGQLTEAQEPNKHPQA